MILIGQRKLVLIRKESKQGGLGLGSKLVKALQGFFLHRLFNSGLYNSRDKVVCLSALRSREGIYLVEIYFLHLERQTRVREVLLLLK